ncbi:MAG: hypothetical protein KIT02_10435 [Devosia sp.]|uniref:hypothetical protein n=1 Tax=Devosia sp. TaxID=1871048 RepID=UPI0024CC0C10|nr:hypothetical protein [Devosia sp.]UYN98383.1 MAG: hypothetical protein KIT02_10435 [Devosia sp.]
MTRTRPMTRAERAAMADALTDMIRDGMKVRSLSLAGHVVGPRRIGRMGRMAKPSAATLRGPA